MMAESASECCAVVSERCREEATPWGERLIPGLMLLMLPILVRFGRRAVGVRQVHAAFDPGLAGHAQRRQLRAERQAGGQPEDGGALAHPQPGDRVHLSFQAFKKGSFHYDPPNASA